MPAIHDLARFCGQELCFESAIHDLTRFFLADIENNRDFSLSPFCGQELVGSGEQYIQKK